MLMGLGCTASIIQSGKLLSGLPVEQVFLHSQSNTASTILVNMTIPALTGVTASPAGSYVIDSFKVALRKQNSHAYVNAAFVLGVTVAGAAVTVSSARVVYGGVGQQLFHATNVERTLMGLTLGQSALNACLTALTVDLNAAGSSNYYGTTNAYRQQVAAGLLYKV